MARWCWSWRASGWLSAARFDARNLAEARHALDAHCPFKCYAVCGLGGIWPWECIRRPLTWVCHPAVARHSGLNVGNAAMGRPSHGGQRTATVCHEATFTFDQVTPHLGASRCRWRSRPQHQRRTFGAAIPCDCRTSTWRSFAAISSGLKRFSGIYVGPGTASPLKPGILGVRHSVRSVRCDFARRYTTRTCLSASAASTVATISSIPECSIPSV